MLPDPYAFCSLSTPPATLSDESAIDNNPTLKFPVTVAFTNVESESTDNVCSVRSVILLVSIGVVERVSEVWLGSNQLTFMNTLTVQSLVSLAPISKFEFPASPADGLNSKSFVCCL